MSKPIVHKPGEDIDAKGKWKQICFSDGPDCHGQQWSTQLNASADQVMTAPIVTAVAV